MNRAKTPDIAKLESLVRRLRAPDGCPWDRKQTLGDLRAYLIEEAHEVAAAIDGDDPAELAGELGDLLFQVVFASVLGSENNEFDLAQVIDGIHQKMIDRHPHVFGGEPLTDAAAVAQSWEQRKRRVEPRRSTLAGVPSSLPALVAAYRMTQKAAGVGFDWPQVDGVLSKVREEFDELEEALSTDCPEEPASRQAVAEELGDLLFSMANLARHLELDPEATLARANAKFRRRFQAVEQALEASGRELSDTDLAELDRLWDEVKSQERS